MNGNYLRSPRSNNNYNGLLVYAANIFCVKHMAWTNCLLLWLVSSGQYYLFISLCTFETINVRDLHYECISFLVSHRVVIWLAVVLCNLVMRCSAFVLWWGTRQHRLHEYEHLTTHLCLSSYRQCQSNNSDNSEPVVARNKGMQQLDTPSSVWIA